MGKIEWSPCFIKIFFFFNQVFKNARNFNECSIGYGMHENQSGWKRDDFYKNRYWGNMFLA